MEAAWAQGDVEAWISLTRECVSRGDAQGGGRGEERQHVFWVACSKRSTEVSKLVGARSGGRAGLL